MIFYSITNESTVEGQTLYWTWVESLYFCVVTLTTVGYGDFSPKTTFTKWFTCFYILIGIASIGVALGIVTSFLLQRQEKLLLKKLQAKEGDHEKEQEGKFFDHARKKLVVSLIIVAFVIGIGVAGFMLINKNDFTDAFYLTIVTVTTVGYGDIPISSDTRYFCIPYILFATLTVAASLGNFADTFVARRQERLANKILKAEFNVESILAMDIDGSGGIDLAEFIEYMLVKMGKVGQADVDKIKRQFKELDADGSGVLDHDDIALLKSTNFSLN